MNMFTAYCNWRVSNRTDHDEFSFVPAGATAIFEAEREGGQIYTYAQNACIVLIARNGRTFSLKHYEPKPQPGYTYEGVMFAYGNPETIDTYRNHLPKNTVIKYKKPHHLSSVCVDKHNIWIGNQRKLEWLRERRTWLKYLLNIPRCRMKKEASE